MALFDDEIMINRSRYLSQQYESVRATLVQAEIILRNAGWAEEKTFRNNIDNAIGHIREALSEIELIPDRMTRWKE